MLHTDRRTHDQPAPAPRMVEPLEDRLLMHGGPGHGHFHFPKITVDRLAATADFNADGRADLVNVDTVTIGKKTAVTGVTVRTGKGDGLFVPNSLKVSLGKADAVVTGDFTGDGKIDIALASAEATGAKITVIANKGNGKFGPAVSQTVAGMSVQNLAAGDVNVDGRADLVAFNDAGQIFVALNDPATGKFVTTPQPPADVFPQENPFLTGTIAAVGDVLGNGQPVLIAVAGDQVFFNAPTAATGIYQFNLPPVTLGSSLDLTDKRIEVADVNGDGKNDLLAIADGSVSVALADATAALTYGAWVTTTDAKVDADTILVGDADGDGQVDLFDPNSKFGALKAKLLLLGTPDGTFHKLLFA